MFALLVLCSCLVFLLSVSQTPAPTRYPTLSPTIARPSATPTTTRPTKSPSRRPTGSPSRTPTKLAIQTSTNVTSITTLFANQEMTARVQITNRLSSSISVHMLTCEDMIIKQIKTSTILNIPGNGIDFFDIVLKGPEFDSLTPFRPVSSCFQINTTTVTDWEPQIRFINFNINLVVNCAPGQFSNTGNNQPSSCSRCPFGTWRNISSATFCLECPSTIPYTLNRGADASDLCVSCPLGHYCPVASDKIKCPPYAYEPASAISLPHRNVSDCIRAPCLPNYFCGSGAAENITYIKYIELQPIKNLNILIKQSKSATVQVKNLVNETLIIRPASSEYPPYLSSPIIEQVVNPFETVEVPFIFDAQFLPGINFLQSSFKIYWLLQNNRSEVFNTTVDFNLQIVTILVTPPSFSYEITDINQTLAVLPLMEIQNTLCNNSIRVTWYPTCGSPSTPLPSWISVDSNSFTPRLIEPERGLPEEFHFSLNYADPIFSLNRLDASPGNRSYFLKPALRFRACFRIDIELLGLDSTLFKTIPISVVVSRLCPEGMFSPKGTDVDGCSFCPKGYYQPTRGSTVCLACPSNFPQTFGEGSTSESFCLPAAGALVLNGSALKCPTGAICNETGMTTQSLILQPENWRSSANSINVLPCLLNPLYCVGGRLTTANIANRGVGRLLEDLSPDGVCRENHTGPFCYGCLPGHFKRSVGKFCTGCDDVMTVEDESRIAGIFAALGVTAAVVIALVFYFSYRAHLIVIGEVKQKQWEIRVAEALKALDITIPIQIGIGFLQVVGGMSTTFRAYLPSFFNDIRTLFSFLALDLVSVLDFGCTLEYQNHFASLLVTSLLPILFLSVVYAVHVLISRTVGKYDHVFRGELNTTTFTTFLVVLFLVYPTCSVQILATFACRSLDNGALYLSRDPSIDCRSPIYGQYFVYAIFMVFVYPIGIPCIYAYLLFRERKQLNPYSKDNQLFHIAEAVRERNRSIQYLKFLWVPYKPRFFWFEVFELIRKLAQTSVVVFVTPGSSGQNIFQLLVTTISIVVMNSILPYSLNSNNMLAIFAQWIIFGITLVTLLQKLNGYSIGSTGVGEYNTSTLDGVLVAMFFAVPVFALVQILYQVLVEKQAYKKICYWYDWDRFDEKLIRMRSLSRWSTKLPPKEDPQKMKSKPSFLNESILPKDIKEALEMLKKLRDQYHMTEQDLNDQIEIERARSDALDSERRVLKERTNNLEAELEKTRLMLADGEAKHQDEIAGLKDEMDRALDGQTQTRRTLVFKRPGFQTQDHSKGEKKGSVLGARVSNLTSSLGIFAAATKKQSSLLGEVVDATDASSSATPEQNKSTNRKSEKKGLIFFREKEKTGKVQNSSSKLEENKSRSPEKPTRPMSIVIEREHKDGSFTVDVENGND